MTDNEIIKALECCGKGDFRNCQECKYLYVEVEDTENCNDVLAKDALDLITRQKAEIERLQSRNKFLEIEYKNQGNLFWARIDGAKVEAVKEFAERLKEKAVLGEFPWSDTTVTDVDIDNLVKEMEGENNAE